jgi:hypothetical protein
MKQEDFDALSPEQRKKLIAQHFGGVELGPESPLRDAPKAKRAHRNLEDEHVRTQIIPILLNSGFHPNVTSVVLKGPPRGVTPGIPDVYAQGIPNFWLEAKLPGNRQSEEQYKFLSRCKEGKEFYVLGTAAEVLAFISWYRRTASQSPVDPSPWQWYGTMIWRAAFHAYGWGPIVRSTKEKEKK